MSLIHPPSKIYVSELRLYLKNVHIKLSFETFLPYNYYNIFLTICQIKSAHICKKQTPSNPYKICISNSNSYEKQYSKKMSHTFYNQKMQLNIFHKQSGGCYTPHRFDLQKSVKTPYDVSFQLQIYHRQNPICQNLPRTDRMHL